VTGSAGSLSRTTSFSLTINSSGCYFGAPNGTCNYSQGENTQNCPQDCEGCSSCASGQCNNVCNTTSGERATSCRDCAVCGDRVCSPGENVVGSSKYCPNDCSSGGGTGGGGTGGSGGGGGTGGCYFGAPNGTCNYSQGETAQNCPQDCEGCAGCPISNRCNNVCNTTNGENATNCRDCAICGNGTCSPGEQYECAAVGNPDGC
jgi:hypothetical protein